MRSLALILSALVWLSGCDMPSLSAIAALHKVDPMTTDPAALRLAVFHPSYVSVDPSGLSFTGTLKATESQPEDSFSFHMIPAKRGPAETRLESHVPEGDVLTVFRIAPDRLNAFRAFRETSEGGARHGSLSVNVTPCLSTGAVPEDLFISVHILTAELTDYAELVGRTDVAKQLTPEQVSQAFVTCE